MDYNRCYLESRQHARYPSCKECCSQCEWPSCLGSAGECVPSSCECAWNLTHCPSTQRPCWSDGCAFRNSWDIVFYLPPDDHQVWYTDLSAGSPIYSRNEADRAYGSGDASFMDDSDLRKIGIFDPLTEAELNIRHGRESYETAPAIQKIEAAIEYTALSRRDTLGPILKNDKGQFISLPFELFHIKSMVRV